MRGASLLIWVLCLVAARACFASPLERPLRTFPDDKHTLLDEYPVVRLKMKEDFVVDYRVFIAALRARLRNPGDTRYNIPVLRNPGEDVPISERFVLAQLSNYDGETVTLALDVTNAYVVGYRAGGNSFFLSPDSVELENATQNLFRETTRTILPFGGSYRNLEQFGGSRARVPLGSGPLDQAVFNMYHNPQDLRSLARAFLVTIQMVAEAARFSYIENQVSTHEVIPSDGARSLENDWSSLSSRIQNSNRGILTPPVELDGISYDSAAVMSLRIIGLMFFRCNPPRPQLSMQLSPLIRLISSKFVDPAICPEDQEPTVQIVGPGGLCADVRDGKYHNGNPIQLYPCRSSDNVNQLWTLKRDGTIRSNGKCLGSYGQTPGDYIMIYDCDGVTDNFKWQLWDNGTIVSQLRSRYGGLVLAARSLESGTTLTLDVNTYTIGQSWLPTNNTEPLVAPIVRLSSGLCLQAKGANLLLDKCVSRKADQAWALYADGSIRPDQRKHDSCLTVPSEISSSSVKIALCEPKSFLQRWVFPNEGTIMNLETTLVLDMTSLGEIIVASFTGDTSQMWHM